MLKKIELSTLGHTWIIDLDGTLLKHNGYKLDGCDTLLEGAKEMLNQIPSEDMILFITSRKESYRKQTISFLENNGIRYNYIIFEAPLGERILINDEKPGGLKTAVAINVKRDSNDYFCIQHNSLL